MSAERSPADPSFPGLEVASNPELMREVFRKHLRPLGKKAYRVQECRIVRLRHQQAFRRVLQYALRIEEPGTGREWSQWVTGTMYAGGRTRGLWEELRRSKSGGEVLDASSAFAPFRWIRKKRWRSEPGRKTLDAYSAFAPFFYIPDLNMWVQVFPFDRRLLALPLLMEGPPPQLEPLLLARFGPGDWQIEAWDVEPVRYLAEMRATLRLAVRVRDATTGRAEERRFYAKIYHDKEKGEQTYWLLRTLWDKASAGGEGFTVGRPIAYLSGLRTLIQEEVSGTPFRDVLLRDDEATPVVRKVARALAALHLDHGVTLRYRLPWKEKEVATLERVGELLQRVCPHLRPTIEETVSAIVAGFEEVPTGPIHGDFRPDHIILDGDRVVLLDLDDFAEADPVLDVARILSYLVNAAPLLQHRRARAAAQTFVAEYFAHVPEAWRARLPLHYAGALLKTAGAVFRRQATDWPDKIEALVEEAKDSLAGRVW